MVFDPAGDMPQANWVQQGCYETGSIPPAAEPDAGTQVWLGPINRDYLPWICGMLDQGRNPSTWIVADDTAMYNILRKWDTLLGLICGNGGTEEPCMLRLQDCVLQSSSDGGTTWVPVTGWAENFGACVRQNMPPPIPPNPGADPIAQHACNLAGYLANEIILLSMSRMISGITLMDPEVKIARDIIDLLPGASLVLDTMTTSLSDFYNTVTGGDLTHYQDASTDSALWSDVTCAIYNAILSVGYVDASNFAATFAAINAVVYTHPEVVNAIAFYFAQIGLPGIQALQVVGAIDNIDCSGCGGWCFQWDFRVSAGPWSVPGGADGVYAPGVGFKGTYDAGAGATLMDIFLPISGSVNITAINLFFVSPNADAGATASYINGVCGGSPVTHTFRPPAHPLQQNFSNALVCPAATSLDMRLANDGDQHLNPPIIQKIHVAGTGTNPFGSNNCV